MCLSEGAGASDASFGCGNEVRTAGLFKRFTPVLSINMHLLLDRIGNLLYDIIL